VKSSTGDCKTFSVDSETASRDRENIFRHEKARDHVMFDENFLLETQMLSSEEKESRGRLDDLEAFSVDDGWAGLVVFLFADPHLLEGGERCEDGASDPDGVFALWWGDDLDLHG
jgi:hypothetical protein